MEIIAAARSAVSLLRSRAEEIAPVWLLLVVPALVLAFARIADEVVEHDTTAFDRGVLLFFRHPGDPASPIGPAWIQETARDVTSFGSVAMLGFVFLSVTGYLLLDRRRSQACFMLVAVGGGQLISSVLKVLFERPRPDLVPDAPRVFTASFPSGHAMLSAVTYLTVAVLLARALPHRRLRVYVVALAVFLTIVVGVSRVYLGVHWPTDVLAGWCAGAAWAIACWIAMLWMQQRGHVGGSSADQGKA